MKCEKCEKEMVKRNGKNGEFLACSGYPNCKNTKPINDKKPKPMIKGESESKWETDFHYLKLKTPEEMRKYIRDFNRDNQGLQFVFSVQPILVNGDHYNFFVWIKEKVE